MGQQVYPAGDDWADLTENDCHDINTEGV